ncbi:MAG: tRNA1(Val) (adenine(37)-N6)-methyltransferase, partial [Deltaproteobacteria bacterium]|nr:tRNA1(Val) (adenine(37)-N6)-methyltransferase [Deltaproteobacteria bacterium]
NLRLLQAEKGYRYSLDPILLARFIKANRWPHVVDLGTGSGILPLLLAKLTAAEGLTGIELQSGLAERAQRNVELNALQGRVQILKGDIRFIRDMLPANSADLVVCNPPFRPANSGRLAPDDERAAARHELSGGITDFIAAADWLLNQGGTFAVVHLAERLPALVNGLLAVGIEPKRLRMVHPYTSKSAKLVLLEGRKGGRPGLEVEAPLYIYKGQGEAQDYTEEVLQMYKQE